MKHIQLGRTDLSVSTLCMGTVYFGSRMNDRESFAFLDRFAELGGNFLDTARVYAEWLPLAPRQSSEKCLGRWLKARGLQEQIIVATKGGHPPIYRPGRPTLSLPELTQQAEDSCCHLGLDTLPLYYLHRDDPRRPVSEIMDALFVLQDRGLIRHLGCSNWTAKRILAANTYAEEAGRRGFEVVSNQWSLARCVPGAGDPTLVHTDEELCRMHRETGLPLAPFTSMAQGYLSKLAAGAPIRKGLRDSYGLDENARIAQRAAILAQRKGLTVAQIAQGFFYAQDFTVVPVMSFSSIAQLEEAAAAADLVLTAAEAQWLLCGDTNTPPQ